MFMRAANFDRLAEAAGLRYPAPFSVRHSGPQQSARKSLPRTGSAKPRVAPPLPVKSGAATFRKLAKTLGLSLFPWQANAARYLTAEDRRGRWLYREVAIIVARQNGKTTLLVPLIVGRLLAGQRIMHTAQNRELPREVFGLVADVLTKHYRGLVRVIRYANGQEEIRLSNGGHYRIVAASRGGARGPSNDLVIVDELREMDTFDFIAAAKPTLTASAKPQMVYLSNAGTDASVVLNALKARSQNDASLAYLEWSAAPHRAPDDPAGWRESNPAMGHKAGIADSLRAEYRAHFLGGTLAVFETEHLCRWAQSLKLTAIAPAVWAAVRLADPLADNEGPYALGIGVAPGWARASIAVAALRADGRIGVEMYRDFHDAPSPKGITAAVDAFMAEQWAQVVAYDATSGGAGEFERHAAEDGIAYDGLKPAAMVAATMDAAEMIAAGRLAVDDPLLDYQAPMVVKRMVGQDGAYRFSRGESLGPIDAVEAMLLAAHAIAFTQNPGLH